MQQLKSGFKRTINWNRYHRKVTVQQQNGHLNFLINLRFQGVNRLFVLSFENNGGRTGYTRHYLPLVEIKDYYFVINGRIFFDQPVKCNLITYDNIRKLATDFFFFFYLGFLSRTFTIHRTAGEGGGIYLTPLYHFHPLRGHLDIGRTITAESSHLRIASSRTRTGNLWFPSARR